MILAKKLMNPTHDLNTRQLEEDYKQFLEYKKQLSKKPTLMTSQELALSKNSKEDLRASRNTGSLSPTSLPSINQNGLRSIKHEDMFINRPSSKIEQSLEEILRHRWKEGLNEKPKKKLYDLSPYEASLTKKKAKVAEASSRSKSKVAKSSKAAKLNHQRSASIEPLSNSAPVSDETVELDKEHIEAQSITNEQ